jgi:MerR family mercuric resistance operon transcriptional regulator
MTIGELARRSGSNVETIRYYERAGIIPEPPRSPGRYRVYDDDHLKRLLFVRRARELGFTLDRVRKLLELSDRGAPRAEVRPVAASHLVDVRRRIADLQKMESVLAEALERCECSQEPGCPVIEALQQLASD